ncbi:MAG: hypothetical protein IJ043_02525 [Clostridia bacterium]|nr:hypothetical protein [Clostridia bacterium]
MKRYISFILIFALLFCLPAFAEGEEMNRVLVTTPEFEVGSPISPEGIEVPADAPYSLVSAVWYNDQTGEAAAGFFEKGNQYRLHLALGMKNGDRAFNHRGYVSTFVVNGERVIGGSIGDYYEIDLYYSFLEFEPIETVELPAFPEVAAGQQASGGRIFPPNVPYEFVYYYVYLDPDGWSQTFEGIFQEGGIYYLMVSVIPQEGYGLTEDTVFLKDGEPYEPFVKVFSEGIGTMLNVYGLGIETVDLVNIQVAKPAAGELPDAPVTGSSPVVVTQYQWSQSDDSTMSGYREITGAFEEEGHYWLKITVECPADRIFSNDLQITVNGAPVERDITFMNLNHNGFVLWYCMDEADTAGVVHILQFLAGDGVAYNAALDQNNDGRYSIADAVLLLRALAK